MSIIYRQGIATQTTARLVVRSDDDGAVSVAVGGSTFTGTVDTAINDGIIAIDVTGLQAGRRYSFTITDAGSNVESGTLKTMPSSGFSIAFMDCDAPATECPAFFRIGNEVDCAVGMGDMPYLNGGNNNTAWGGISGLDGSTDSVAASADVSNYLAHHLRYWHKPSFRKMVESIPYGYMPDDHEFPNNNWALDTTGSNEAGVLAYNQAAGNDSPCTSYAELVTAEAAAKEALVPYTLGNNSDTGEMYFSFRPNDDVEVFVLDCSSFKNLPTAPDTNYTVKFMLGATQRTWLVDALAASTATFKIIGSPKRPYDSNDDGWDAYTKELIEIQTQIVNNSVTGVIWTAGDTHNSAMFASEAGVGGATYDHVSLCGSSIGVDVGANVGPYHAFQLIGVGGDDQNQNDIDAYGKIVIPPGGAYADLFLMRTTGVVILRKRVQAGANTIMTRESSEEMSI